MKYDLIIVGMGISGISAAIYAKNSGLNVLLLERDTPGGLLNKINIINNYPGYTEVSGPDLSFSLFQSVLQLKIPYKKAEVVDIEVKDGVKLIKTDAGEFESSFVLLATGRSSKTLGLKNEDKFYGKGISTCALCDGNLYEGKDICVVGGGNSALEEALYLSNIVRKVYLVHRRDAFRGEQTFIEKIKEKENIEILYNSQVTDIMEKEEKIVGVLLNGKEKLEVSALFLYIGFTPGCVFVKNLGITDSAGYIEVQSNYETKVTGIYAVGDCIKKEVYQLITAANDGVMAALDIIKRIEKED